MKRNWLVLLFALACLILLIPIDWQQPATATELHGRANQTLEYAGISANSQHATDEVVPRVSFEKTIYDLGDVGQGTKNSCEFRFTNTGRGLLKIGKISRTCGCTVFQLDKKEYTPSKTAY